MRTRALLVAAVLTFLTLAGCGGADSERDSPPTGPVSSPSAAGEPEPLPLGKSELALSPNVQYVSPEGFAPAVSFQAFADGWVSTHRSADAFDVSRPLPAGDGPLEVIAFIVPPEGTGKEALAAIAQRADQAGATVARKGEFVVTGGDGPLIVSRDQGIALDAVPDGTTRVETTDPAQGPVLRVLWVPDAANLAAADDAANVITSTIQVS